MITLILKAIWNLFAFIFTLIFFIVIPFTVLGLLFIIFKSELIDKIYGVSFYASYDKLNSFYTISSCIIIGLSVIIGIILMMIFEPDGIYLGISNCESSNSITYKTGSNRYQNNYEDSVSKELERRKKLEQATLQRDWLKHLDRDSEMQKYRSEIDQLNEEINRLS